ncbi:MAG: CAP domain-containing protein [Chloroflexota bacterium]
MSSNERIALGVSLALNAILAIAVIFLWVTRPTETSIPESAVAQIEAAPTTEQITQTPVVITVVATPTTEVVIQLTPESVVEPTATAVPTETPAPTQTPEPSPTTEPSPTPQPTATEAALTGPDWLRYVNQFRVQAGVPLVIEHERLSEGAASHSYYMVINNSASHSEDPNLPGYTAAGHQAAQNGNIAVSGAAGVGYRWPIDYWISAAFHTIPLLDPQLATVGYGEHNDATSSFGMAATMDINSGARSAPPDIQYPIMFPRDGGQTWVTTYSMPEFPNTASSCSGYQKPTGAPIILMLGDGENTPQIQSTSLLESGVSVPHCAFDETNYTNPTPYWQTVGRQILDERDAVVILPRSPLEVGQEYTVIVNNGGEEIQWTFTVTGRP